METITIFAEKIMSNKYGSFILGAIAVIAPLYFLKTVFNVWFGPPEILIGFKSEQSTWAVLTVVDAVALFTTLPSRKKRQGHANRSHDVDNRNVFCFSGHDCKIIKT